jgi:hypothetical protein
MNDNFHSQFRDMPMHNSASTLTPAMRRKSCQTFINKYKYSLRMRALRFPSKIFKISNKTGPIGLIFCFVSWFPAYTQKMCNEAHLNRAASSCRAVSGRRRVSNCAQPARSLTVAALLIPEGVWQSSHCSW